MEENVKIKKELVARIYENGKVKEIILYSDFKKKSLLTRLKEYLFK
jgi:hypothetical protein